MSFCEVQCQCRVVSCHVIVVKSLVLLQGGCLNACRVSNHRQQREPEEHETPAQWKRAFFDARAYLISTSRFPSHTLTTTPTAGSHRSDCQSTPLQSRMYSADRPGTTPGGMFCRYVPLSRLRTSTITSAVIFSLLTKARARSLLGA